MGELHDSICRHQTHNSCRCIRSQSIALVFGLSLKIQVSVCKFLGGLQSMIRLQSEEYRYQTTRLMIAAKELPHPVPAEEPSLAEPATRELSAILRRQLNGAWFVLTKIANHSIDG